MKLYSLIRIKIIILLITLSFQQNILSKTVRECEPFVGQSCTLFVDKLAYDVGCNAIKQHIFYGGAVDNG